MIQPFPGMHRNSSGKFTGASQNSEDGGLFMGKAESELHVKIKHKTKSGRVSRFRKQKDKSKSN